MDCNTTYYFCDKKGNLLAESTFLIGYTNIGHIVEIEGKLYSIQEVVEKIENGDNIVNIILKEERNKRLNHSEKNQNNSNQTKKGWCNITISNPIVWTIGFLGMIIFAISGIMFMEGYRPLFCCDKIDGTIELVEKQSSYYTHGKHGDNVIECMTIYFVESEGKRFVHKNRSFADLFSQGDRITLWVYRASFVDKGTDGGIYYSSASHKCPFLIEQAQNKDKILIEHDEFDEWRGWIVFGVLIITSIITIFVILCHIYGKIS